MRGNRRTAAGHITGAADGDLKRTVVMLKHGFAAVNRWSGGNSETEFRAGTVLGKSVSVLRKTARQNEHPAMVGRWIPVALQ